MGASALRYFLGSRKSLFDIEVHFDNWIPDFEKRTCDFEN